MTDIFASRQGDFPQQSLVDCKGKQRSLLAKRPFRRCAMLMKTASKIGIRSKRNVQDHGKGGAEPHRYKDGH